MINRNTLGRLVCSTLIDHLKFTGRPWEHFLPWERLGTDDREAHCVVGEAVADAVWKEQQQEIAELRQGVINATATVDQLRRERAKLVAKPQGPSVGHSAAAALEIARRQSLDRAADEDERIADAADEMRKRETE